MAPVVKRECLTVMDKLCTRPVAQVFLSPCATCFDARGLPLTLSTVRRNLRDNRYSSVSAWKSDVELVWAQPLGGDPRSSIIDAIARDLQNQFRDLTRNLTDFYRESWKTNLLQMHTELATCIRELIRIRAATTRRPVRQRRDQLYPSINGLPPAHMRRHFPFLGKDELLRLPDDLNSIRDERQIAGVAALLRTHEPELVDGADIIELDVNLLRPTTLRLIRQQVDQILHL
jgi:hypothetical protein